MSTDENLSPTEQEKPRWFSMRTVCQNKLQFRHFPAIRDAQVLTIKICAK